MNLTLEEMVVLSNTPSYSEGEDCAKSTIAAKSQAMLMNPKLDFVVFNKIVDDLVLKGFINKELSSYTLHEKVKMSLKEGYDEVQMLMLSIYTKVN